jgi:signal transduction histidine kinase
MALVDYEQGVVTRWLMLGRDGGEADDSAYTAAVPIDGGGGAVIETLQTRDVCVRENGAPPTSHEELNRRLGLSRYAVLPMLVRSIPIGVLIVEGRDGQVLGLEGLASAKAVAEHGSLILWTTRMCMERAQRLATQEERDRIAREIHDAVSQSLFGIAFTLDGCLRLLPHQAELVREKLQELHGLALRTMADMRRFIFDMSLGGLTTDQFIDELQDYIHDMGSPEGLTVGVSVDGDITELSPYTRKHLFRIAQEALANVIKHADGSQAAVRLEASGDLVRLSVTDNGKGISHEKASTGGGLGLTSIRERVRSIGGTLDIRCAPGEGTRIEVRVPRL